MDDDVIGLNNMEAEDGEAVGFASFNKKELLEPITAFFSNARNFDSMPISSKVIVFDIDIKVKDAFQVASENGMYCDILNLIF